MTDELKLINKALIGAVGGLCLSLLKLIEAGFYMNEAWTRAVLGAYLTYLAHVLLGMFVATIFTERKLSRDKAIKKAFSLGVVAPSILLAMVGGPIKQPAESVNESVGEVQSIPEISSLFIPPVYAEGIDREGGTISTEQPARPAGEVPRVQTLTRDKVKPSLGDGVLQAIGRPKPSKDYMLIVGSSRERKRALETATEMNRILAEMNTRIKQERSKIPLANVIQPRGSGSFYVRIGGLDTAANVVKLRNTVKRMAEKERNKASEISDTRRAALWLLSSGTVIKGESLFRR